MKDAFSSFGIVLFTRHGAEELLFEAEEPAKGRKERHARAYDSWTIEPFGANVSLECRITKIFLINIRLTRQRR